MKLAKLRTPDHPNQAHPLRGHLVVFVGNYKYHYKNLTHLLQDREGQYLAFPDTLTPALRNEVGSMLWWEHAWVVGDNPRQRLCKPSTGKPFMKFKDYDEAIDFVFSRQQRHKQQSHVLVYITNTVHKKERMDVIRSMDDIKTIHLELDREIQEEAAKKVASKAVFDKQYPRFDEMESKFGRSKAFRLADMIRRIRDEGKESVMASIPRSSWYRLVRELDEAGIAI